MTASSTDGRYRSTGAPVAGSTRPLTEHEQLLDELRGIRAALERQNELAQRSDEDYREAVASYKERSKQLVGQNERALAALAPGKPAICSECAADPCPLPSGPGACEGWKLSPATNRPALPVNGKRNEG
jgi:hypothetical protein